MLIINPKFIPTHHATKFKAQNDFSKRIKNNILWHFSRFQRFRKAYSCYQNQIQRFNVDSYLKRLELENSSIFNNINIDQIVNDLKKNSIGYGLQLPHEMTQEILDFAQLTPATEPKFEEEFLPTDVQNSRLKNGRYVMRGLVNQVRNCQAINKIAHDPLLIEIVRQYLGYIPTLITIHLTWSFASDLPETEIQKMYPPTNFHYDVAGYNFMTSYFYITDVDVNSGPHIMIKNSRDHKPLKMLLSSNCQTNDEVYQYYGKESEIVITGKSGFGFVQDPSCIHKLKAPSTSNRLLLQIRYS